MFLYLRPTENRIWHPRFWWKPAYGYLPHFSVFFTVVLAVATGGGTVISVCVVQTLSLLLFMSTAMSTTDVLKLHEWTQRYCWDDKKDLRESFTSAYETERTQLMKSFSNHGRGETTASARAGAIAELSRRRQALSTQLMSTVQGSFLRAAKKFEELDIVDETLVRTDISYIRHRRDALVEEALEQWKPTAQSLWWFQRISAKKKLLKDLEKTFEATHLYYRFSPVVEDSGVVLQPLGKMHMVMQPHKGAISSSSKVRQSIEFLISFGFLSHAWAHSAAANDTQCFLDLKRRKQLNYFSIMSNCAIASTIAMEIYGAYILFSTLAKDGALNQRHG